MGDPKNVVIIGGGIIGCTTAYYLSHHPLFSPLERGDTITLLEATKVAGGASGKAGGLLASWAYPACIAGLSFSQHAELAARHGGEREWGFRRVRCGELRAVVAPAAPASAGPEERGGWAAGILLGKWRRGDGGRQRASVLPGDLDWFDGEAATGWEEIAGEAETAQVHPLLFTQAMARLAGEKGVRLVLGRVTDINCADDVEGGASAGEVRPLRECLDSPTHQRVVSVTYVEKESGETKTLGCNTVVLAAGPWTPTLLPGAPISSLRAHSVTIRPNKPVSPYCLFTEITLPDPPPASTTVPSTADEKGATPPTDPPPRPQKPRTLSPEIYARPNNEIYICGPGDTSPLPPSTDAVLPYAPAIADLLAAASAISPRIRDGVVTGRRACYLPTVDVGVGGGPLVGGTDVGGLVLAAGHSCWGVLNAPGTGKCVAELVWEGAVRCADVGGLDPRRIL